MPSPLAVPKPLYERAALGLTVLFCLVALGALWAVSSLASGLVRSSAVEDPALHGLGTTIAVLGGVGVLGLSGLALATGSLRRRSEALEREVLERSSAEEALRVARDELERRVEERTRELAAANAALRRGMAEREAAETEAREAREAAEAASMAKSQFLANMSHELRTPLNAIIGYSEMLLEEAADLEGGSLVPDLAKVHAAGKHLLSLINDILDISKIEAGKMDLFLETFEVAPLVADVASTIRPLAEKNNNRLEVVCPDDLGEMSADTTRLRQCLFNLLSNACKFTSGGVVTLEASRAPGEGGDWLTFRVADTGIGLTPEQLGRLFQPFTQADSSTTRKYGGTGLGLVISRRFCQMMGGDVSAESEPGRGAAFTIALPERARVKRPAGEDGRVDITLSDDLPDRSRRVLVVDDDPSVRDLLMRFLTKEGYGVVTASRGEETIALAKQVRPSVIVLDVLMPGMDGWAVLTQLKNDPETADVPVLLLSMVDDKSLGFSLGAADYLTKPVDRARLSSVLKNIVDPEPGEPILVVDDEPDNRDLLARALRDQGWEVETAENGRAALALVAERRPKLILLDLMMPEMDGFEFLVRLRENAEWGSIPVVVVTAKDLTEEDRARLRGCAEEIVQKASGTRDELLERLGGLVAAHAGARARGA